MAVEVRNQRIEGTSIYVFSKDNKSGLFTYSRPISLDEGKVSSNNVSGLNVAENGVLYNMSTLRGIQANRKLMAQTKGNVWLPTINEGLLLNDSKLLPSGELMDFGIALYGAGNPDKEIAEKLMADAKQKGYQVPILASFKSIDLKSGGKRYGSTPIFVSQDGLITGEDAKETLKRFSYVGDSGVRGLGRYGCGDWYADWDDDLGNSSEGYRVGRVSAVGSAQNLKELVEAQIKQNYSNARSELELKLQEINSQEKLCVESAEKILA
ncbi:MAG: hypothetical protein Q7R87_02880 [Nanoarchaeota archaeon]|nr:hypothetical protein [Nanoarchaeota archaeon]